MRLAGPVAVLALLVVTAVLVLSSPRAGPGGERGGASLRRFLQYTCLLAALLAAAWGLALLLEHAVPVQHRFAGRAASDAALGLALSAVGLPAWLLLWQLVWSRLHGNGEERESLAWSLYLLVGGTVALVVALVHAVGLAAWVARADDLRASAVAGVIVWGGVWALHSWAVREPSIGPTGRHAGLPAVAGSAVGLVALVIGASGVLLFGLEQAYQTIVRDQIADTVSTAALRRSLVLTALGTAVWWWHWLRDAAGAPRTTSWNLHVVLLGILGGLLTATVGAGVAVHAVLQWLLLGPAASTAAVQFEVLPGAVTAVTVGGWAWWYHRAVLRDGEDAGPARTEAERGYEHLVAAVGLLAAAGGAAAAVGAAVQALAPAPAAAAEPGWRTTLVAALTLAVVGVPLWALYWSRLQRRVRAGDSAEARSPSRRSYVFLVLAAAGLAAAGSLAVALFLLFGDLLDGAVRTTALYELRVPLALLLAASAVFLYHWRVYRADRAARPERPTGPRAVLLISADGRALAEEVSARTGARVRVLRRLDGSAGQDEPDAEAVAAAVLAAGHERLVVLVDETGGVRVIPYG